ncbi:PPOX class probable FMN-dependent enzyme, family [Jannaschia seosinensis]|uniref:PPOX class probable FMN-dependent enzyme, family n=1 Tax=Jannaschia seosinensis TaxID=313367 RepID=A0A0M7B8X8_9RHOB|nr:pyridoxamine 5'-phosphate oxidase family protein [Jannaschia seosinensis]CUH35308.1 PPOX class probable FMN-dependent enzyme, family [Jannaschia seosinensis]
MSDPFDDLTALEDHVWGRLDRGAAVSDDPFRYVTLATMGAAGPEARVVAIRRAVREAGEVEIHSDRRTAKIRAIEVEPRAALLFWDSETQMQLRLSVTMRLLEAEPERWSRIPDFARRNYGTDPAPGTPVGAPEDVTRSPEIARFAALVGRVRAIDALSLAHESHRRARFDANGAVWVAP